MEKGKGAYWTISQDYNQKPFRKALIKPSPYTKTSASSYKQQVHAYDSNSQNLQGPFDFSTFLPENAMKHEFQQQYIFQSQEQLEFSQFDGMVDFGHNQKMSPHESSSYYNEQGEYSFQLHTQEPCPTISQLGISQTSLLSKDCDYKDTWYNSRPGSFCEGTENSGSSNALLSSEFTKQNYHDDWNKEASMHAWESLENSK